MRRAHMMFQLNGSLGQAMVSCEVYKLRGVYRFDLLRVDIGHPPMDSVIIEGDPDKMIFRDIFTLK